MAAGSGGQPGFPHDEGHILFGEDRPVAATTARDRSKAGPAAVRCVNRRTGGTGASGLLKVELKKLPGRHSQAVGQDIPRYSSRGSEKVFFRLEPKVMVPKIISPLKCQAVEIPAPAFKVNPTVSHLPSHKSVKFLDVSVQGRSST